MLTLDFNLVLCLVVYLPAAFGLYEGDPCTLKNGAKGICKFLTECPEALNLLLSGVYPENCGFEGTQSIVCCKGASSGTASSPTERTTTTTERITKRTTTTTQEPKPVTSQTVITGRTPGKVSKEKCEAYAQYAYNKDEAPTLSLISHHSNVLECAFDKLQLIVGGTLASRFEFPHMALIGYQPDSDIEWSCGGSIISENFILTAGHCLKNRELGNAKYVRVGLTNQTDLTHMQERTIIEIIRYPEYVNTKYHDIGLFKLDRNLDMNPYVRPACLQTEKRIAYNNAIASGWGKVEFSGDGSSDLLKVVLEFFPLDKCNKTYKRDISQPNSPLKDGILDKYMVCAGSSKELKDTCQGDSGGPLQVYHDESKGLKCMYDIVGVTSFGKSCGLAKNVPGVYTRVSAYIEWIEGLVWPE